jgi:ATP-binding cassette, subfamily B, bacterial
MYDYIRARLNKAAGQSRYLPRTLSLVWAAAPRYTFSWAVLLVLQGVLPVATVYLTRALVNSLIAAVRAGGLWTSIRPVLILAVAIAVVMLLTQVFRSMTIWVSTAQAELTADHINQLIHERSVTVDLAFYESPESYDHLHRARAEGSYRPIAVIENLGGLLQNSITLVAMIAILVPFGPILPIALILSTVPALYVVLSSSRRRYVWNYRRTAAERRCWYYDWLLTSGETAAEIRLFGLGHHFRSAYETLRRHLRFERMDLARRQGLGELCAGFTTLALSGLAMALMVLRALRGLVSVGDLALFYQAFNQGLTLARSLLDNVGKLYENTLFLGNLFEFLSLKPQIVSPACAVPVPVVKDGIQFENVSFRYPGTDRFALRDFNMTLKSGQITALVGPNGAGKSTIIKLLCRFYEPECGAIRIDGIPLPEFSIEDFRRRISVLFQSPVRFNSTAAENIHFGDLECRDDESVRQVAAIAGANEVIASLPHGFQTSLGKQFSEGIELSTGEWQRIAMARAFLRHAPIMLLDEPTSEMDPWAEITWAEEFKCFTQGRISLLVTHRFTTAMFSDVIHVMAKGAIVESGTHGDLLALGGLYAEGWASQRDGGRISPHPIRYAS